MVRRLVHILLILAFLLCSGPSYAGVLQRPTLIRLGQEVGLPQVGTNMICQDSDNNIWIASELGDIVCYNGYDIVFSRKYHSISLPFWSSNCNSLFFIGNGNLYSIHDSKSEPSSIKTDYKVSCIGDAPDGKSILLTSTSHFCLYDPGSGVQDWFEIPPCLSHTIRIHRSGKDLFLADGRGRLFIFDINDKSVKLLKDFKCYISCIVSGSDSNLWIATLGDGLYDFSPADNGITRYSVTEGLSSNYVHSVCLDSKGRIWAGTKQGLDILDLSDSSVTVCMRDPYNRHSLSHDTVRRLFKDSQGGVWIGTYFGGINYWHESFECFKTILPGKRINSLNDFVVSSVAESEDGIIWIGTNRGGLNKFDPATEITAHYPIPQLNTDIYGDFFNNVQGIWPHPDGRRLYLTTNGCGLLLFDRRTEKYARLSSPKILYSITPDEEGSNLILGTNRSIGKLYSYNFATDNCSNLTNKAFLVICKDSYGRIWIRPRLSSVLNCGDDGIKELETGLPDKYDMVCAVEDTAGNMWIGGKDGLLLYDRQNAGELRLGPDDIPTINSIAIDDGGALWMGTANGLYRYNTKDGTLKKYGIADGLASGYFCENAVAKSSNGRIWFGGVGGITVVYPDRIVSGQECPAPVISSIYVNERNYPTESNRFVLDHRQNNISFRLSTPDYCSLQGNKFQCKLEGVDRDWSAVGSDRMAYYKNLQHGHYSLSIRASGNAVDWTEASNVLSFRIKPVWYKSAFAVIAWIVLTLLLIFFIVSSIIRHKTMKSKLLLYEMEEKYASEKSKLKVLKFLNSHLPASTDPSRPPVYDISPKEELFLSKAIEAVERNLANPDFGVEELASALRISRMTLHTKMKELTSDSALRFINKIRFGEACRLLTETNLSVAEICDKVGGRSYSNFASNFKRYIGCTPQQYARSNKR